MEVRNEGIFPPSPRLHRVSIGEMIFMGQVRQTEHEGSGVTLPFGPRRAAS
jgi:hypothetical protein